MRKCTILLLVLSAMPCDAGENDKPGLGMWVWPQNAFNTGAARRELLDFCAKEGISHVDQHVRIEIRSAALSIANADALTALVVAAQKQGMTVNALRGGRDLFLEGNHVMGSGGPGKTREMRNDWLTVSGGKIGIETGIGHQLGDALDEPVLILKSSIGNRSLGWDLLPPGSPRHEVETTDKKTGKKITLVTPAHNDEVRHASWTKGEVPAPPKHTWHAGLQYLGDIARAQDALKNLSKYYPDASEYEVAGFLWWQGDKDRYNAAHSAVYGKNLHQLFKALRKEFNAPKAKMVVATLGQTNKDSATGNEKLIIDGMFAFGNKNKGEAAVVYTNPISMGSSSNAHYGGNAKTYMNVGLAMGKAMVKLLKD